MNSSEVLKSLQNRRTYKVIGNVDKPETPGSKTKDDVDQLLEAAGNAPFHYASGREHHGDLPSCVPWRVYKIDATGCRALMSERLESGDATKIPNMLAAAQFLLQVTWLPDPGTISGVADTKDGPVFDGTLRNMEHIAAGSAFTQSLLLAADSFGFKTYWSSGGPLRGTEFFDRIGIPQTELLLGSIFLFPPELENSETKHGAMADKRGAVADWSRWIEFS
ncbi:MAG: hypothetical protein AAF478_01095 [Pseudomonadota bacterium]